MKTHTVLALGMIVLIALIFIPLSTVMADPPSPKVVLCHNGHTIEVSVEAAAKHMINHGDEMGPCPEP